MKKMKKLVTLLLAVVMVLTMNMAVFAATSQTGTVPSENDTATITVVGVEADAAVTAYQIVKADYKDGAGLLGYSAVKSGTIANVSAPKDAEIKVLAKDTTGLTPTVLTRDESGNYTADVAAGTYLILVTKTNSSKIYNPMIVSASYGADSKITEGSVNAGTSVDITKLTGGTAYAKSEDKPDIDKNIVEGTDSIKFNDKAVGDIIVFKIKGTIPSYSSLYEKATYTISDTLSEGLTVPGAENIAVKVGSKDPGEKNYSVTVKGQKITVTFTSEYILSIAGAPDRSVEVTYSAVLNENAVKNFDANTNTATLTYSDTPDSTTFGTEKKTNTYTFDINADVKKVDATDTTIALAGAIFKLTNGTKTYYAKSTSDGKLEALAEGDDHFDDIDNTTVFNGFTGLDAGDYTMTEVKAPAGYTLNTEEVTVMITPIYENNTLKSYTVAFKKGEETVTTRSYTAATEVTGEPYTMKDTKIAELPSTGGRGTILFTIVGCAIMILAAAAYFNSRKRSADKQ